MAKRTNWGRGCWQRNGRKKRNPVPRFAFGVVKGRTNRAADPNYAEWRKPMQRAGSRGFTLVEVLVVIAALALLAAFLFPVFSATRERARQGACLGQLRQLGQALTMYR